MNTETLTRRQLAAIITGAEDDITALRQQLNAATRRLDKNQIHARITGRQSIIKRAKELINNKKLSQ